MNYRRIALAAVVAWIVSIPVGYLVNNVLFTEIYAANRAVMRTDAALQANLPLGFAFLLVGYLAFAYVYAKGYEGGNGIVEGVRFGVVAALLVTGFGLIWQYVMYPITGAMSAAIIVDTIVEMAIYGAIVGGIYKPLPTPTARTVAV